MMSPLRWKDKYLVSPWRQSTKWNNMSPLTSQNKFDITSLLDYSASILTQCNYKCQVLTNNVLNVLLAIKKSSTNARFTIPIPKPLEETGITCTELVVTDQPYTDNGLYTEVKTGSSFQEDTLFVMENANLDLCKDKNK